MGVFFAVAAGLLKIVLLIIRKDFRLHFAKTCFRILLRKKSEAEKMKYLIWGLNSYDAYLRRFIKLQISDLKAIYSKVSSLSYEERRDSTNRISKAFESDNDLEPLTHLTSFLKVPESEQLLSKQLIGQKIKIKIKIKIKWKLSYGIPGTGGGTANEKAASNASTLPKPYQISRPGTPRLSAVIASNLLIATLRAKPGGGHLCEDNASATEPVTWEDVMLVPLLVPYPPPGIVDKIFTPGAQSSTFGPLELNDAIVLTLSIAETAMTELYFAGKPTVSA